MRYLCEHLSTDVDLTALAERRLPPQPQARERIAITVSSEILADYVGTYGPGSDGDFVVTLEDDQLMLELVGFNKYPAVAESETEFLIKEAGARIEFVRGDDGFVKHLIVRLGPSEATVPRK